MPSERLIRTASARDATAIADIYRPYVTDSAVSFELEAPDAAEMATRIEKVTQWAPWLVCELSEQVVGYAYATRHRDRAAYQWSVEVSAYVRQEVHRAGIARALYNTLFDILVRQGFYSAYAGITLPNPMSEAFHRALGFEPIGIFRRIGFKFGRWHDVGWSYRPLRPYEQPAGAPIPFPHLNRFEQ